MMRNILENLITNRSQNSLKAINVYNCMSFDAWKSEHNLAIELKAQGFENPELRLLNLVSDLSSSGYLKSRTVRRPFELTPIIEYRKTDKTSYFM